MTTTTCGPPTSSEHSGVNTHIDFAAYGYQNLSVVEASGINYLGVKNLRDSPQSDE